MEKKIICGSPKMHTCESGLKNLTNDVNNEKDNKEKSIVNVVENKKSIINVVEDNLLINLKSQIEEQRLLRMEDAKKVEAKANKIKLWVTNKLKDLEDQNALLREQNAKCNVQLELLKGRLDQLSSMHNGDLEVNSAHISSNVDRNRMNGEVENPQSRIPNIEKMMSQRPSTLDRNLRAKQRISNHRRTNSSCLEERFYNEPSTVNTQLQLNIDTHSLSRDIHRISKDTHRFSRDSLSMSPRNSLDIMLNSLTRNTGLRDSLNQTSRVLNRMSKNSELSSGLSNSTLNSATPIPQPRTIKNKCGSSLLSTSVDGIDFNADSTYFRNNSTDFRDNSTDFRNNSRDFAENSIEITENPLNSSAYTLKAKDEIHDYSEIYTPSTELHPWGDSLTLDKDKPPTPPLHRFPSWESRIYQVAQKGLSESEKTPKKSKYRHNSLNIGGSYSEIHVPVYATVKGRASQIRSVPFSGDSSDSSDGEDNTHIGSDSRLTPGSGTSHTPHGRPTPSYESHSTTSSSGVGVGTYESRTHSASSDPRKVVPIGPLGIGPTSMGLRPLSAATTRSSNESSSSSILSPKLSNSLSPTKSVRRDISFESGMSSDYAIPPDARSDCTSIKSIAQQNNAIAQQNNATQHTPVNSNANTLNSSNFATLPSNINLLSPRSLECSSLEKTGHLTKLGGKLKTWRKRFFVLKDGTLSYWKSQSDIHKKAAGEIQLDHGSTVSRSEGAHTFEVNTGKKVYYLTADNTVLVEEWVKVLQNVLRRNATRLLLSREETEATLQGWLTKVKHGHTKHCWCALIGKVFVYYKSPNDKTPLGQINMRECRVEDLEQKLSDGSDQEQDTNDTNSELTIGLFPNNHSPTYLICCNKHEKDAWIYHLTIVSSGGQNVGTQYEQLVQKLMELDGDSNCILWQHPLLLFSKEILTHSFTTLPSQQLQNEAVKLFKSCQLYTSVLMEPNAIDYHVVLCQNALHLCLDQPELQAELFCGLLKQTSVHTQAKHNPQVTKTLNKMKQSRNIFVCATQSLFLCDSSGAQKASPILGVTCQGVSIDPKLNPPPYTFIQGWQFLALAVSLFVPKNNKLLWYLKLHLQRYSDTKTEMGKYAIYCSRALQRTVTNGPREAKPSRMEVLSILLKNPYHHSLPHAIPVHFFNGTYQVVGFDGSTSIEEFLLSLNNEIGCRDVHSSGFALFSDDPIEKDLEHCLNHNAKLCDVISKWETALREKGLGKFENTKVIRLMYKNRLYWRYALKLETDRERLLLCYQTNAQIQQEKFPITKDLALELTTLLAQIDMPEANSERPRGSSGSCGPSSTHVNTVYNKFYPQKYKNDLIDLQKQSLLDSLMEKWQGLKGRSQADCVRIFLTCARKWAYFGATLFPAHTTQVNYEESTNQSGEKLMPISDATNHSEDKLAPISDLANQSEEKSAPVWVAVNEEAVVLMDKSSMQPIVKYAYSNIVTFGGCQEDFMLVVHTPEGEGSHPPGTHKLLLCMSKPKILELTLLIADYMNALGRGLPGTPQTGTLTRQGSCRSARAFGSAPHAFPGQPDILQTVNDRKEKR